MRSGRFITGLVVGILAGMTITVAFYFRTGTREIDANVVAVAKTLADMGALKTETEAYLLDNRPFENGLINIERFPEVETMYRSSDGDIIFRTVQGQLVWLHPDIEVERISWRCYGGSWRDVPVSCRGIR